MKDYVNALFCYAQENQVPPFLRTQEYNRAICGLEEGWESFRAALTTEQEQTLDLLLSKENTIERMEAKAAFAAGISIGLDLGRL